VLEQFERFAPDVLESFQRLVATGRVELLSETYYHSLSSLNSTLEFQEQVDLHKEAMHDLFNYTPRVFRNTELIYSNALAGLVENMGYQGILTEGADKILEWKSPNFLYHPPGRAIKILLKNYRLSDDIAFRFGERSWNEFPLTAPKFANWISKYNGSGQIVNLFMDYETFGEHQWEDTGIFEFLRSLPLEILKNPDNNFVTPSEAIARYAPIGELDVPDWISWADVDRDLSAWMSNTLQNDAFQRLYGFESAVKQAEDPEILENWRRLQTSDHFYYMCTKWFSDGDVHKYFNPHESPYDAFISYMNVLHDLELRLKSYG
jgi:alpha-amylase